MKQMGDSVTTDSRLEVSVSFGRFENDALAWEKWSSFSPNKYLEEVGSLSTPGSVAQKKAYFEAHYKRIAARKAEELDQEKLDPATPSPDVSRKDEYIENSSDTDTKLDVLNGEMLVEEVAQEDGIPVLTNLAIGDEAEDDNARSSEGDEERACTNGLMNVISSEEEREETAVAVKCGSSTIEEAKDESNVNVDDYDLNIEKDSVLVGLETPQKPSQHSSMEKPPERKKAMKNGPRQTTVLKNGSRKLNAPSTTQKVQMETNCILTVSNLIFHEYQVVSFGELNYWFMVSRQHQRKWREIWLGRERKLYHPRPNHCKHPLLESQSQHQYQHHYQLLSPQKRR